MLNRAKHFFMVINLVILIRNLMRFCSAKRQSLCHYFFRQEDFFDELDRSSPYYSLMKILKARMVPVRLHPITFAKINGKSPMLSPYMSQQNWPVNIMIYMVKLRSFTFRCLMIFHACGTNAEVVNTAATIPIVDIQFI